MSDSAASATPPSGASRNAYVLDHLSGTHRGTRQVLSGEFLRVGTAGDSAVHFPIAQAPAVALHHAVLQQQGSDYVLMVESGQHVEVNGKVVETHTLAPGDVIRFGTGGPIVRFRRLDRRPGTYKSMSEVLGDCADSARLETNSQFQRAAMFLRNAPVALLKQPAPWLRATLVITVVLLLSLSAMLIFRLGRLEQQVTSQTAAMETLQRVIASDQLSMGELEGIRSRLETAEDRVGVLEDRTDAGPRVIAAAAQSVVFIQGSYGFKDPASGEMLRIVLGPDGRPVAGPGGTPFFSASAEGPLLERMFSGTAFVATDDDLLVTNRHIALPWESDEAAQALVQQGLLPEMIRLLGYLPGIEEPFAVELVVASDTADVAVLKCDGATKAIAPLGLSAGPLQVGEEVFVLGYPTGMQALIARSSKVFVEALMREGDLDYWAVARRLSEAGHINPLTTRGIVGQVTSSRVVYDAATTSGGSGGPVIGLDGNVHAVNSAILVEFGGSNLGVPAEEARVLLEEAAGGGTR